MAAPYPALVLYGFDGILTAPTIAEEAATSAGFSVPKHAGTASIFVPALDRGATVKLQSLSPYRYQDVQTWYDIWYLDSSTGLFRRLSELPSTSCTVIAVNALSGGVMRFVASAAQLTSKQFNVIFSSIQA